MAALPLSPLAAQRNGVSAEEAVQNTKDMYGPPPPTRNCSKPNDQQSQSEIVVCARKVDDSQFRVKSTSELDPNSKEATDDGLPRAPDVAGDGIFKGKGMSLGGTPDPAYMIDFKLLPDAPEGSDADRIAKGEKKAD
ncbi:hypothetical protein [Altererythrobacter fulvus]|uniref:hypothetical protein n=1 Tax=Caenibius fulvus TaxID=2126012 RepID=UPI0030177C27